MSVRRSAGVFHGGPEPALLLRQARRVQFGLLNGRRCEAPALDDRGMAAIFDQVVQAHQFGLGV